MQEIPTTYSNGCFPVRSCGSDNWETMVDIINELNLSGEDVLRMLTNYHGLDLLRFDFMDNLITTELGYEQDEEDEED